MSIKHTNPKTKKFARRFPLFFMGGGAITVLVFAVFVYFVAGDLYNYSQNEHLGKLPEVDVVVCLAGAKGRIKAAGNVWFKYLQKTNGSLPKLYVSGMGANDAWRAFSLQVDAEVLTFLKPQFVELETISTNTNENALIFAEKARFENWRSILLVTSDYHMKRSIFIFDKILNRNGKNFKIYNFTVQGVEFDGDNWRRNLYAVRVTFFEYIKWLYYRIFW